MDDLSRQSGGAVSFLDRRCYENYLLHPAAIAKVLSKSSGSAIDSDQVLEWIQTNGRESKYIDAKISIENNDTLLNSIEWLKHVNAPKLLADLFGSLPENPEEYRKTTHSIALTDWLLANAPDQLHPIADLLKQCFDAGGHQPGTAS